MEEAGDGSIRVVDDWCEFFCVLMIISYLRKNAASALVCDDIGDDSDI